MKYFKILPVLAAIIVTTSFLACSSGSSSPGSVIEKSYDLMNSKDFESVSKLYVNKDGTKLSDEEYKKLEGLVGMGYSEFEKKGGIGNITIDEEKISEDGKTATINYTVKYRNDKLKKEKAKLINVDGKWYMLFAIN